MEDNYLDVMYRNLSLSMILKDLTIRCGYSNVDDFLKNCGNTVHLAFGRFVI